MLVRDEAGKVYLTAPDIICFMDMDTYLPLTNADTKEGMNIFLGISPVDEKWWLEDFKAYECWKPILEAIGYTGGFVDINDKRFLPKCSFFGVSEKTL